VTSAISVSALVKRAGKVVTIEGLQPGVNGEVYILASRHIVSARSGYTTEFSFCATNKGG